MKRLRGRARPHGCSRRAADDAGSVLPITIGYAMLALALVLVAANATSLFLEQRRLDAVADAAATAASDAFALAGEGDEMRAALDGDAVAREAALMVEAAPIDAQLVSASIVDERSTRVTVRAQWRPVIVAAFVPQGVTLESVATSRTALR